MWADVGFPIWLLKPVVFEPSFGVSASLIKPVIPVKLVPAKAGNRNPNP